MQARQWDARRLVLKAPSAPGLGPRASGLRPRFFGYAVAVRAFTTSVDLARWLELVGGLWTVDGEPVLGRTLPVPASAVPLAHALRARNSELVLLAPGASGIAEGTRLTAREIERAAHWVEGHRVFQLAWVDASGAVTDSWLLAEHDQLAQSGDGEVTAARIVAGDRSWTTPRIKRS